MARAREQLAEALYAQERFEAAEELCPLDGGSSVATRLLARRDRVEEALARAHAEVERVDRTDVACAQAEARVDLAEVLALAGREREACVALEAAGAIYERKRAPLHLRRVREAAASLAPATAPGDAG